VDEGGFADPDDPGGFVVGGAPGFWPCFMIFLYLDRLFWNQILTWNEREKRMHKMMRRNCGGNFVGFSENEFDAKQ
jgi:hypothetical protein